MTWISLVCLLALSSAAFGRSTYSSFSGRSLTKPTFAMTPQLQQDTQPIELQQPISTGYGSSYGAQSTPKVFDTLPTQSYGQMKPSYGQSSRYAQFDQQNQQLLQQQIDQQQQIHHQQQQQLMTQADILCKGQAPETVIPIGNGERFVVCLDDTKGFEQSCPKGLIYRAESQRCERKFNRGDACASQPCLNGGQCIQTEQSFQCQCTPGYDGKTCELDARVCQTQQPCGQSQESKCQSFHVGAALQHVCIVQNGLAYGLSAQQTHPNPCRGVEEPKPLAFSDKGFILCDGEDMFVQSCPGGTIWNDLDKTCTWPELQNMVEVRPIAQQSYGQSSYGQRPLTVSQVAFNTPVHVPKVPKLEQMTVPRQQISTDSYGTQTQLPRFQQQQRFDQVSMQRPQQMEQMTMQRPVQMEQMTMQRPVQMEQMTMQRPQQFDQMTMQRPQQFDQMTMQRPIFQQPQNDITSFGVQKQDTIPMKQSSGY